MDFRTFLTETFVNAFTDAEKKPYIDEVWDILQKSYEYIGGIKGEEFTSPEAMLKVPFWKMIKRDGKVIAVTMYKDHNGRKSIAFGTDGSKQAKVEYGSILEREMTRSYKEVSGAAEKYIEKYYPELYKKYRVPVDQVEKIIGKKITPEEDGYHYKRMLGDKEVTKILLGTPGKKFY